MTSGRELTDSSDGDSDDTSYKSNANAKSVLTPATKAANAKKDDQKPNKPFPSVKKVFSSDNSSSKDYRVPILPVQASTNKGIKQSSNDDSSSEVEELKTPTTNTIQMVSSAMKELGDASSEESSSEEEQLAKIPVQLTCKALPSAKYQEPSSDDSSSEEDNPAKTHSSYSRPIPKFGKAISKVQKSLTVSSSEEDELDEIKTPGKALTRKVAQESSSEDGSSEYDQLATAPIKLPVGSESSSSEDDSSDEEGSAVRIRAQKRSTKDCSENSSGQPLSKTQKKETSKPNTSSDSSDNSTSKVNKLTIKPQQDSSSDEESSDEDYTHKKSTMVKKANSPRECSSSEDDSSDETPKSNLLKRTAAKTDTGQPHKKPVHHNLYKVSGDRVSYLTVYSTFLTRSRI